MVAAVIDSVSGLVLNLIVADPLTDQPLPGSYLVNVPEGLSIRDGCIYRWEDGFVNPPEPEPPPLEEEALVNDD